MQKISLGQKQFFVLAIVTLAGLLVRLYFQMGHIFSDDAYFIKNKIQQCKMAQILAAQKQFASLQKEYFSFSLKKELQSLSK